MDPTSLIWLNSPTNLFTGSAAQFRFYRKPVVTEQSTQKELQIYPSVLLQEHSQHPRLKHQLFIQVQFLIQVKIDLIFFRDLSLNYSSYFLMYFILD